MGVGETFGVSGGCTGDRVSSENGSGGNAKLNRDERPPTGQSEEALRFHSTFRRQFQLAATKVPFLEVGVWETEFRFPASKVPFSEVGFSRGEKWPSI